MEPSVAIIIAVIITDEVNISSYFQTSKDTFNLGLALQYSATLILDIVTQKHTDLMWQP